MRGLGGYTGECSCHAMQPGNFSGMPAMTALVKVMGNIMPRGVTVNVRASNK